MATDRLIPLGVITAPHGIRGEVRIRSFTANPDDITSYGPLRDRKGNTISVVIKSYNKDVVIASIKGIASREQADALRHMELCVPRSALPESGEHEYYHEDLIGLRLMTEDGAAYGIIAAVHNFGAGDMVSVRRAGGEEDFIPFTRATFPRIDLAQGSAVIVPPSFQEE